MVPKHRRLRVVSPFASFRSVDFQARRHVTRTPVERRRGDRIRVGPDTAWNGGLLSPLGWSQRQARGFEG